MCVLSTYQTIHTHNSIHVYSCSQSFPQLIVYSMQKQSTRRPGQEILSHKQHQCLPGVTMYRKEGANGHEAFSCSVYPSAEHYNLFRMKNTRKMCSTFFWLGTPSPHSPLPRQTLQLYSCDRNVTNHLG